MRMNDGDDLNARSIEAIEHEIVFVNHELANILTLNAMLHAPCGRKCGQRQHFVIDRVAKLDRRLRFVVGDVSDDSLELQQRRFQPFNAHGAFRRRR